MIEIDPITERMRSETGHDCDACSMRARNLFATASNAASQIRRTLDDGEDLDRAYRKLGELERELALWEPITEKHFDAMGAWKRP